MRPACMAGLSRACSASTLRQLQADAMVNNVLDTFIECRLRVGCATEEGASHQNMQRHKGCLDASQAGSPGVRRPPRTGEHAKVQRRRDASQAGSPGVRRPPRTGEHAKVQRRWDASQAGTPGARRPPRTGERRVGRAEEGPQHVAQLHHAQADEPAHHGAQRALHRHLRRRAGRVAARVSSCRR